MEELFELFYECNGVSTDTRKIEEGNLFVALKGDNFDGNQYASVAIERGAKYAIVDDEKYADNKCIFFVPSGLKFLQDLANYHRRKFDIPVIGITGSNGKTTTKELIATVLNQKYSVLYTKGNLNNHIGVPLTLLRLTEQHEIAIIEMGASKIGDIQELTAIAEPNFGIITNIGHAHIGGFGSYENVIKAKTEMYQAISVNSGHIFFNQEDEVLKNHLPSNCETSSYSTLNDSATICGKNYRDGFFLGLTWKSKDYSSPQLLTHLVGEYNIYNALAAITIGVYFNVDNQDINKAITSYQPSNNRSQFTKTENNTLIVDCYNANPTSTLAALKNFSELQKENKLFILGDMLELGEESTNYHKQIIEKTEDLGLQGIFVGKEYKKVANKENNLVFMSVEEARNFLETATPKNNLILLKGSRGIGLEKLIDLF